MAETFLIYGGHDVKTLHGIKIIPAKIFFANILDFLKP
jgi:hypothetical protein